MLNIALETSNTTTFLLSSYFLFLISNSLKKFAYEGIFLITSNKRKFILTLVSIMKRLENYLSCFDSFNQCRNGNCDCYNFDDFFLFWEILVDSPILYLVGLSCLVLTSPPSWENIFSPSVLPTLVGKSFEISCKIVLTTLPLCRIVTSFAYYF